MSEVKDAPVPFHVSLIAGGIAGTSVDIVLFPLDTIKTRLQAPEGFAKAGGFRGLFKGITAAAAGSAPGASLFFSTYEMSKQRLESTGVNGPVAHMTAASMGETAACLVRVPTEIIKQRMQANQFNRVGDVVSDVLKTEGAMGFWRGYGTTVLREIPFSLIQFPLYEAMKAAWRRSRGADIKAHEAALCGSISGAFAAACTTPLDVVKTRLMLGADKHGVAYDGMVSTFQRIVRDEGAATLLSGIQPRVMWIGIGGFVFFGAYEGAKRAMMG